MCLFFISYSYQFFYVAVSLLSTTKPHSKTELHRFAVLIAARNEESVIGNLIDSIRAQNYPKEFVDIYVAADNCTDSTAMTAQSHGAEVYSRSDTGHIGKGYVLNFLLEQIGRNKPDIKYDAYLVLDADNVLSVDYITEMNKTFSDGYEVITSYRNSKNYGANWISAGYALWFLHEAKYLNQARMALGSSCAVSGTGFIFSDRVIKECGGWHFFLLTEDIEFTIHNVVKGRKIGYCPTAVLYDEQPTDFRQSWRQRLRWSRGYLQVFHRYGISLLSGICHGSFSCYDMTMNIMPATLLTCLSLVINTSASIMNFYAGRDLSVLGKSVLETVINLCLTLFILGGITTATEWKNIYCPWYKKVIYTFTFPFFMMTYLPICIVSLFKDPSWQPIYHKCDVNLSQIKAAKADDTLFGK